MINKTKKILFNIINRRYKFYNINFGILLL